MKTKPVLLLLLLAIPVSAQQPESATELKELGKKLDQATRQLEQLNETVESLRAELARLKGESPRTAGTADGAVSWGSIHAVASSSRTCGIEVCRTHHRARNGLERTRRDSECQAGDIHSITVLGFADSRCRFRIRTQLLDDAY